MNNETKELIRDCNELLNDEFFTLNNIEITRHELNLLLDYITNLQQENEKIRKQNLYEHKYGSDMEGKYLIEKARNDKAIEFINEYCKYNKITVNGNKYYDEYILNNVIDILRGENK